MDKTDKPTDIQEELEKLYKVADFLAIHYHALHQHCTALLARSGASGPPYAIQVAAYREARHEQVKAIEDALKQAIKEHQAPKIIKTAATILGPDGKKVH